MCWIKPLGTGTAIKDRLSPATTLLLDQRFYPKSLRELRYKQDISLKVRQRVQGRESNPEPFGSGVEPFCY